MNTEYTVVSSKNNSLLLRSKTNNLCYRIHFKIVNFKDKPIIPKEHIGFDTYNDLFILNNDILENISVEEINNEPNSRNILMEIKPFGQTLGVKGKYIVSKVNMISPKDELCVGLVGSSVALNETNFKPNENYEELICKESKLFAFWDNNESSLIVQYDFTLIDPVFEKHGLPVPRVISDVSALLIKKLFLRIKEFKEIQINKTI